MDLFCIFCGKPLTDDGVCANPDCKAYTKQLSSTAKSAQTAPGLKKPMPLIQRKQQILEQRRKKEEKEELLPPPSYADRPFQEEEPEIPPAYMDTAVAYEESKARSLIKTTKERIHLPRMSFLSYDDEEPNVIQRLFSFIGDYYRDHQKTMENMRKNADTPIGIIMLLVSLWFSALGTMFLGAVRLEDFFFRWVGVGLFAPLLAYSMSYLFAGILVGFRGEHPGRANGYVPYRRLREIFSVVGASATFPNLLLLLTGLLSPFNRSMEWFQFFALLLVIAWAVCLFMALTAAFKPVLSMKKVFAAIGFLFFAITIMRSLWVWFLTGVFDFTMFLPLNVFFTSGG